MKNFLFFFAFVISTFKLTAQEKSWDVSALLFLDTPMSLTPINSIDLKGSSVDSKLSIGQAIIIDKNIFFKPNFSYIIGGGFGGKIYRLAYVTTFDFFNNPFERDISNTQITTYMSFAYLYTGIAYKKSVKTNSFLKVNLRGGLVSSRRSSFGSSSFVSGNQRTTKLLETDLTINEKRLVYPLIVPGVEIIRHFPKQKIKIIIGVTSLIAPISYISGEVKLFGNTNNYELEVSDKIMAIGASLGISFTVH